MCARFASISQNNQNKNLKIYFCYTSMEEKHIYSLSGMPPSIFHDNEELQLRLYFSYVMVPCIKFVIILYINAIELT